MNFKKGDIVQYAPADAYFIDDPTFEPGSVLLIENITDTNQVEVKLLFGAVLRYRASRVMPQNLRLCRNPPDTNP